MRILYLSISKVNLSQDGLYESLVKEIIKNNHKITIVQPGKNTNYNKKNTSVDILEVNIGDVSSKNVIKKGINNILLEHKFKKEIKRFMSREKFDLVLYATPPITFSGVIEYCKKIYKCKAYLMLKDIFPQNAVDIGMFSKKSIPYKLFKRKEKYLYEVSDFIGCMSEGNRKYLLENEKWIDKKNVELFPNTLKIKPLKKDRVRNLSEYGIKKEDLVFIFGGNLGKPQGINFLLAGIQAVTKYKNVKFIIVGNGTEVENVKKVAEKYENLIFINKLEKEKYDQLIKQCDIGIISLDYRFTIPNYPSRTLAYMENAMPIMACTDKVTDIKELIEIEAKCGKWCYSDNIEEFKKTIEWFVKNKSMLDEIGERGRKYFEENFNVEKSIKILESHFRK